MIKPEFVRSMAAYNGWQNDNLYSAADTLSDSDRRADRGAFFGSIHATFNHLLWGDLRWMSRFADVAPPEQGSIPASVNECEDWDTLKSRRADANQAIIHWADGLSDDDLAGDLTWYSGAAGRDETRPLALLITHFFNHQTHHRGQIHAMLTAAGARPGDTDLFIMPEDLWP
jgi:uncharacterized damage-inducible protein DinB